MTSIVAAMTHDSCYTSYNTVSRSRCCVSSRRCNSLCSSLGGCVDLKLGRQLPPAWPPLMMQWGLNKTMTVIDQGRPALTEQLDRERKVGLVQTVTDNTWADAASESFYCLFRFFYYIFFFTTHISSSYLTIRAGPQRYLLYYPQRKSCQSGSELGNTWFLLYHDVFATRKLRITKRNIIEKSCTVLNGKVEKCCQHNICLCW